MMIRLFPKLIAVLGSLLLVTYLFRHFHSSAVGYEKDLSSGAYHGIPKDAAVNILPLFHLLEIDDDGQPLIDSRIYRIIHSNSTGDGKYLKIHFDDKRAYNPSIIPHPTKYDSWIVIAQQEISQSNNVHTQIVCSAGFWQDTLVCSASPESLPFDLVAKGQCHGDQAYLSMDAGPRDARAFYGPIAPYIIHGAHSSYTCLGEYLQDLRVVVDDFRVQAVLANDFKKFVEIKRPPPYQDLEKNFFAFWNADGKMFIHTDISPKRVFAEISADGTLGQDLAPKAAMTDEACMAKYMPQIVTNDSVIHQATNSLAITMCKRKDPTCKQTEANTFILTIFQYKVFINWHGMYEPYIMLFRQTAPYAVHAISMKPFWINGRTRFTKETGAVAWEGRDDLPDNHSELFYVSSISWKTHGQRYHGYIDDVMFIGFGIEDSRAGVIDVVAEDLLQDLKFCGE